MDVAALAGPVPQSASLRLACNNQLLSLPSHITSLSNTTKSNEKPVSQSQIVVAPPSVASTDLDKYICGEGRFALAGGGSGAARSQISILIGHD